VQVRQDAIDAPGFKQPFVLVTPKVLGDTLHGKTVTATKKKDRYERTVGHVLLGRRGIYLEMLEEGMVWHPARTSVFSRLRTEPRPARRGCGKFPAP